MLPGFSITPYRRVLLPLVVLLWLGYLFFSWQWRWTGDMKAYVARMRPRLPRLPTSEPDGPELGVGVQMDVQFPAQPQVQARPFTLPTRLSRPVDVHAALTSPGRWIEGLPFTAPVEEVWRTSGLALMRLGSHLSPVEFGADADAGAGAGVAAEIGLLGPADQENGNGNGTISLQGQVTQPAVLRLPQGLEWEFAVIAQGRERKRGDMQLIGGKVPIEQVLIAFGANLTHSRSLARVSATSVLSLPGAPSPQCKGGSAHMFGPSDPQVFWSDSGLPQLVYLGMSAAEGRCRAPLLVRDLRDVWAELGRVMRGERRGVLSAAKATAKGRSKSKPAGKETVELERSKQRTTETGWMPFFPGALVNHSQTAHFQYTLDHPALRESSSQPEAHKLVFESFSPPAGETSPSKGKGKPVSLRACISRFHSTLPPRSLQPALPLQRLTLCARGTCTPDPGNTLHLSLVHIKKGKGQGKGQGQEWGRLFTGWNVTTGEMVSVGPEFRFAGTDDSKPVYARSMAFLPSSPGLEKALQPVLGLSHGFLDDDALFGLGIADKLMSTIVVPVKDLLSGSRLCEGV